MSSPPARAGLEVELFSVGASANHMDQDMSRKEARARPPALWARLLTEVASALLVFTGFAVVVLAGAAAIAGVAYELFRG